MRSKSRFRDHEIDLYDEGQDGALDREEIVEVSRQLRRLKEDL